MEQICRLYIKRRVKQFWFWVFVLEPTPTFSQRNLHPYQNPNIQDVYRGKYSEALPPAQLNYEVYARIENQ